MSRNQFNINELALLIATAHLWQQSEKKYCQSIDSIIIFNSYSPHRKQFDYSSLFPELNPFLVLFCFLQRKKHKYYSTLSSLLFMAVESNFINRLRYIRL